MVVWAVVEQVLSAAAWEASDLSASDADAADAAADADGRLLASDSVATTLEGECDAMSPSPASAMV